MDYTVARRKDLLATGWTQHDLSRRHGAGEIERVRHGVYAGVVELSAVAAHRRLVEATMPLVHPGSVVSHVSAAVLWRLPARQEELGRVRITRLIAAHGRAGRSLVAHATPLAPDEWTELDGLRLTTLARTTVDLSRALPYEWAVITCDAALAAGLDAALLAEAIGRRPRLRGIGTAGQAAAFADARSESPCESLSRVQLARTGLPAPELQYVIRDAAGSFVAQCDFAWPQFRLVGEADGRSKYGELLKPGQTAADAVMAEKEREERIRQEGGARQGFNRDGVTYSQLQRSP